LKNGHLNQPRNSFKPSTRELFTEYKNNVSMTESQPVESPDKRQRLAATVKKITMNSARGSMQIQSSQQSIKSPSKYITPQRLSPNSGQLMAKEPPSATAV
jgi:hypothetical protein